MTIKIFTFQLKRQIRDIKNDFFIPSIQSLTGRVLEIGFGQCNNFKFYDKNCEIYGIDIKIGQLKNTRQNKFHLREGEIEHLPFEDNYFDAVVGSFVLCSVKSVERSISEINRVLKDRGRLVLLEHVKSEKKTVVLFQKITNLICKLLTNNCHLDRTPQVYIKKEKFHIVKEEKFDNYLEPYLYIEAIKNGPR